MRLRSSPSTLIVAYLYSNCCGSSLHPVLFSICEFSQSPVGAISPKLTNFGSKTPLFTWQIAKYFLIRNSAERMPPTREITTRGEKWGWAGWRGDGRNIIQQISVWDLVRPIKLIAVATALLFRNIGLNAIDTTVRVTKTVHSST